MSPSIGDLLGDEGKEEFFGNIIVEGSIVCYYDKNIKPDPKDKFIIIACKSNDTVLVVYINSIINPNFNRTDKEKNLHYPIKQKEFSGFLDKDSFIDCCHPTEKTLSELAKEVSKHSNRNKGNVSPQLLQQIIHNLELAHTIPTKLKKKYGLVERNDKGKITF